MHLMRRLIVRTVLAACVAFAIVPAVAGAAQQISVSTFGRDYTVYRITEPVVTAKTTSYPTIAFAAGDLVRVSAGGCVQSGGHGLTWKRYVDPSGPPNMYAGTIRIPGHESVPIATMIGQTSSVPANAEPNTLVLGYQDERYGDNGYSSHDNGTDDQCLGEGAAWLVVVVQHPYAAGSSFTSIPAVAGVNGLPILTTDYRNPGFDTTNPAWSSAVCSNQRWLANDPPSYEWTPVYAPADQFDDDALGISGLAVFPADVGANGGISGDDVPFTHPFGGVDWETFIAPDQPYTSYLAASNTGVPPNGNAANNNGEYIDANARAVALGLSVPKGVQGNETDKDLIPLPYRALEGDRVAVLGRWIVDCGHEDFHTEIHPALLFVRAQAIVSGSNPDVPAAGPASVTYARIVGRPFLTGQEFGDGNLRTHLTNEVKKVLEFRSNRIEAHPLLLPKPFSGIHLFSYVVRAPVLPRANRIAAIGGSQLVCSFHFTTRTGVAVQVTREAADAVRVIVSMNAAAYTEARLPIRSDFNVTFSSLKSEEPSEASDIDLLLAGALVERGALGVNIDRGILTDRYATPIASSIHDGEIKVGTVDALPSGAHFSVDDDQPFPIYGWLTLEYRPKPPVVTGSMR
jgi:hypothetical protein